MAVFMLNVCKFNSCGLTFKSLGHLIQHIEETHIDYDPHVVELSEQQQPACVPLSYVLRFLTDAARRENGSRPAQPVQARSLPSIVPGSNGQPQPQPQQQQQQQQQQQRLKSLTPTTTGSEPDTAAQDDSVTSEPDDSNDSWPSELANDFMLRYASRSTSQNVMNQGISKDSDKPFACPVPGCKKRYKNVNGIKYHSKNGHKNDGKVRKAFKCQCGKSYKTPYGLKNHASIRHGGTGPLQVKLPLTSKQKADMNHRRHHHHHHHHHHRHHRHHHHLHHHGHGAGGEHDASSRSSHAKLAKVKVPAIQDHGYMKQDRSMYADTESECESNNLGVLTPASSPPPTAKTDPASYYSHLVNSSQMQRSATR